MESWILKVSCKVNVKPFGLHLLCKRPKVFMIPWTFQKSNSFLKCTIWRLLHRTRRVEESNGSVLDLRSRGWGLEPHCRLYVVSLSKVLYPLLCTGSTQEDLSQNDWKIVDWDVENQNKQFESETRRKNPLVDKRLKIGLCYNYHYFIYILGIVTQWELRLGTSGDPRPGSPTQVTSLSDCQDECSSDSFCTDFTFEPSTGNCYIWITSSSILVTQDLDGYNHYTKQRFEASGKYTGPMTYAPRREKTCLRGFRQSKTQTVLLSYRDLLENWNFAHSKSRYDTFKPRITKMLIRLCGCTGWSAPVLFTNPRIQVYSRRGLYDIHYST